MHIFKNEFDRKKSSKYLNAFVQCNEKSAWHKTFSLVMGPDEPINAVLGQFPSMTVTILDKEAAGSLVLPSPPSVVSLEGMCAKNPHFSIMMKLISDQNSVFSAPP